MQTPPTAPVNGCASPPPVPPFHRWHCPLCGASFRHPCYLADHLQKPSKLGMPHGLDEQDAWAMAANVAPVDATPGLDKYPTMPAIPMATIAEKTKGGDRA